MSDHTDPLAEPRTTPVSLRRRPAPVTLRDLIRNARAAGVRSTNRNEYAPSIREWWTDTHRIVVRPGWNKYRVIVRTYPPAPFVEVDMQDPTIAQVAAALELCGWDIRRRA